jgi:hypothetical protein
MARSTYVYTVHHSLPFGNSVMMGTFTVKHEMVSAVEQWLRQDKTNDPAKLIIKRSPDGRLVLPEDITQQFVWGPP